jgi:probable HAF family extracellular repeat protein
MHIKHRWSARTAAGLVLFLAAACAWSAPRAHSWRLVDLGTLGGSGSFATAVSDNGFVAGCSNTPSGDVHAFLYRNGRMVDLAGDEAGNSCALAVNGRGEAAGRNGSGELVVWSGNGVVALGVKGNVGAMNDAGLVVGSYTADGVERAFAWEGGTFRDLGAGPGSTANDVNARGEIVGQANGHAFAMLRDGVLRDLGTLGGSTSVANGINERGQIVGMADTALHRPTAFVYSGTMRQLAGPEFSGAVDVDNRGLVVSSAEGYYGYIVQGDAVTRLDKLPDVVAKGWHHMEPTDMNARGWIAGTGFDPEGNPRAFLLLPR